MIIRKWCESCGCVTPPAPCGGCQYCKEADAERAVIAAAEAWRDGLTTAEERVALRSLGEAIDTLRLVREGK